MNDEITIKRSDLIEVFEYLRTINNISTGYEKEHDEQYSQKYLYEWTGIYMTISKLGLIAELKEWKREQIRQEDEE